MYKEIFHTAMLFKLRNGYSTMTKLFINQSAECGVSDTITLRSLT